MKLSYHLLQQLVPDIPPIAELAEKITMHLFEVESSVGDVLDIKILPNRYSDAACYFGLAREIAAICAIPYKEPKIAKVKSAVKKAVPADNSMPNLCRRIATAYVENLKIAPSPDWLTRALEVGGIRSINNLVDITNYVMLETGQPLHAFDYEKIQGGEIIVRQAHDGEIVETLDGKKIALNPSVLVLADEKNALDIAGIKGGTRAAITDATKTIAVTAAHFDGALIYKTAKRIGVSTDAAIRFSHHLSPALVDRGLYRALELIHHLSKGNVGIITDAYPKQIRPLAIACDVKKYNALTGCALTDSEFFGYLKKLGFRITGKKVIPPPERTDIEGFHDVVEEVARLYGLERIAPAAPRVTLTGSESESHGRKAVDEGRVRQQANENKGSAEPTLLQPPSPDAPTVGPRRGFTLAVPSAISACKDRARALAANAGYAEIYTHSFTAAGDIVLENPLTAEQSFLRASLLPGLKKAAEQNLRFNAMVKLFEIGSVFFKKTNHDPEEEIRIGFIISSKKNIPSESVRVVRGSVQYLLSNLGIERYQFAEHGSNGLTITIADETVGAIAYEHNEQAQQVMAEINLTKLASQRNAVKEYQPIASYPSITRDLSLVIDKHIRIGKIIECIEKTASHDVLRELDFVNSYEDKNRGAHKHSLTFRMVFRDAHRTLEDQEADRELQAIIAALKAHFQVEIR